MKMSVAELTDHISRYGNEPGKAIDIEKEIKLISEKKSTLSAIQRKAILRVWAMYQKQILPSSKTEDHVQSLQARDAESEPQGDPISDGNNRR
jgi:hypothetical protein